VALVLTPALTATLLRPRRPDGEEEGSGGRFPAARAFLARSAERFNRGFERGVDRYARSVTRVVDRKWLFLIIYALVCALLVLLFFRLPTSFLPTEDQGAASVQFRLPAGATQSRTIEVQQAIERYFREKEPGNIRTMFTVTRGGAREAPRRRQCRSDARLGSAQRASRRRDPQGRSRTAQARRARDRPGRRQLDPLHRLGRPLRQRLHQPRPGEAGLRPGRRALSRP